jgi:hypothetical protein
LYEEKLKEACDYHGHLVYVHEHTTSFPLNNFLSATGDVGNSYWDWSLDWKDLTASPIWNTSLGFGGDGDPDLPHNKDLVGGSCIQNGPFAGYKVRYLGRDVEPHCLSRGFGRAADANNFSGDPVSPAALQTLLSQETFPRFFWGLEDSHDVIPFGVGGDFRVFTAPNGTFPPPPCSDYASLSWGGIITDRFVCSRK